MGPKGPSQNKLQKKSLLLIFFLQFSTIPSPFMGNMEKEPEEEKKKHGVDKIPHKQSHGVLTPGSQHREKVIHQMVP